MKLYEMKNILLLLALVSAGPSLFAQNKLIVTIEAIREKKGSVLVGLFSTKDAFLKKATYGKVVPVGDVVTEVVFENIEPGEYGISIIHDLNNNGELDTNTFGIPKEGFG